MQNHQEIKKLLSNLISLDSSSGNEKDIGDFIAKYLQKYGFKVSKEEVSKGRNNIFAEKGKTSSKKAVMFLGHLDTVNTKENTDWKTDPLKAVEVDGKLFGLGSSDIKGGISAFLEASKDSGAYIKILLTVDEENISEGSWDAIKNKEFFQDIAIVISAEPNLGMESHEIANGRSGRCVFNVVFEGKSEHILKYKMAVDSINLMAKFVSNLYDSREKIAKDKNTVIQVRKVNAESVGMSVCGEATIEVEVLLGSQDSISNLKSSLQKLAGKHKVSLKERKTPYLESYEFPKVPFSEQIAQVVKKYTGKLPSYYFRKSVADDNVLASLNIPVITWGANGGNEHKANEFVELSSMYKLSDSYYEFLLKIDENNN